MSKHTPGPWRVSAAGYIRPAGGDKAVALVYGRPQDESLIAAAPDLLEACHDVKNFLANLENGARRDDPLHAFRLMVHKPLHAALDAAIAKAEGRPADAPAAL